MLLPEFLLLQGVDKLDLVSGDHGILDVGCVMLDIRYTNSHQLQVVKIGKKSG